MVESVGPRFRGDERMNSPTVHASAVLVGARAVLIRGPSGAGKSRLALELLDAARDGRLRFARLVGDDRVHLESANGRLLVRPAQPLAGLIELRGVGLLRRDYEPCAVVGLVIDLDAADAERLPDRQTVELGGTEVPRLAVASDTAALPAVLALITSPVRRSVSKHTDVAPTVFDWRLVNHNGPRLQPAGWYCRIKRQPGRLGCRGTGDVFYCNAATPGFSSESPLRRGFGWS